MPAAVVPSAPAGLPVPQYAVVGTYATAAGSRFVQHVALTREVGTVTHGIPTNVWHMGPPLVAGPVSLGGTTVSPSCPAHVVGWVTFTTDEREGITDWLAEVDKEDRPAGPFGVLRQYTVSTNAGDQWHRDEMDRPLFRRFSCVSFVTRAYQEGAGVELINRSNPATLPPCPIEVVARVYGPNHIAKERVRASIGLIGAAPWQIELAGYVCHALNRPDEEVRAVPYTVPSPEAGEFP